MTKKNTSTATAAANNATAAPASRNPLRFVSVIPKSLLRSSQNITRKGWSMIRRLPIKKPPQLIRWDLLGVTASYIWGLVNRRRLPVALRSPLYSAWAYTFKCNMDEIPAPLDTYPSLAEFFSRPIKEGTRPIAEGGMVSPVDGRVLACGEVLGDKVEQVKGVTYSLQQFLGCEPSSLLQRSNTKLYQCILYLSPGDYHRIHSSEDWTINKRSHFPGTLFPVNKPFLKLIPSLFALNERIVLMGDWTQGFYSLTAVGAYNVGSISLSFDEVNSNRITRDFRCKNLEYFSMKGVGSHSYDREYEHPVEQVKGQEIGQFHLGSTVVLIFEAEDFEFNVQAGDYCKMGSLIGSIKS
ncbi:hypothetical protein SAMD00019534_063230 [Acytostelium subglobosum LB1]|uniref:hypothetical protein n=1 Tax=Acytostelium subglobosum LB1 TaxID=1410327 RepID=UPI000644FBC0|nr:hypothetical protein SAMD00019534_063230 [Acytostelium subglobosum LB1]GAM23148.1 hypothetical protein SAMD00019534_063230 [Acytostelium subglobosum LB1]|eukprot:XP_012753597.1 hypothetical protein SAMD00019534_063230 [Acytostelium subglobosum LB1]